MINVGGVPETSGVPRASEPKTGGKAPLADFDQFLYLFVEQLKNQDPLNPMGNEEFMAQTAQFSSLEQLVNLNDKVDGAISGTELSARLTAASLIGRVVTGETEEDGPQVQGTVTAVDLRGDAVHLLLDTGEVVPFDRVSSVHQP